MIDVMTLLENKNDQKINYDRILRKIIETWQEEEREPSLLIHSCCAPCSTYTLEFLIQFAKVTIFFANSNIHPESEYRRRALVQKTFIDEFNQKNNCSVGFIEDTYKPNEFISLVKETEMSDEPEGGKRCTSCFQMRLDLVAERAVQNGYDYFGSALTISPKKNAQLINTIGIDIQKIYDVKYLPSDFKKNSGYQRSIQLCKEYDIYRQCYCGCVFAAKQQGIDLKKVNKEAKHFLNDQKDRSK